MAASKKKIINAHMHVFTGDIVPPYLAKTMLVWPFYLLINTSWLIAVFRRYYKIKFRKKYRNEARILRERRKDIRRTNRSFYISSHWYLNILYWIILIYITLVATLYFLEFLSKLFALGKRESGIINYIVEFMKDYQLLFIKSPILKALWVLIVLGLVKWSRRFLRAVLELLFPVIKKVVGKKTQELAARYVMLGRFAFYKKQSNIAQRALDQLPPDSSIVILPMDMEYMGAGKTKMPKSYLAERKDKIQNKNWKESDFQDIYKYQMRELWSFVKNKDKDAPQEKYHPFLFVDPRRVEEEGTAFFDYELKNGKMLLKDCFVKNYLEDRRFSGFKIYPAIGYYPFDKYLLPIWRYAAENNIPITSHCVFGTIFYRGKKEKKWNFHPVFEQKTDDDTYSAKLLKQSKNLDFQVNFTHPMNYLCLLEERFLRKYIAGALKEIEEESKQKKRNNHSIDLKTILTELFAYVDEETPLTYELSNLKICLAHFAGEEEWLKYLESDRQVYSQRLMRDPVEAIRFMHNSKGEFSWYKINELWDKADWYSLICSLMIRYKHVYSDLSYIFSKESIYPLLKHTLDKGDNYQKEHEAYLNETDIHKKATHYSGMNKLRSRVLFGTDFYVVRNHKSDKDLYIEAKAILNEENFDLVARENPHNFLTREYAN